MHIHGESLTNDKAAIASEGSLSIETTGKSSETSSLSNQEGRILSNGTMDIRSHILDNTKGTLSAGKSLSVRGKTLQNKEGKITAYGHMALTEDGSLYNREGSIEAHENADIKAGQVENTKGRMTSGESLTVSTPDIQLDGILAAGKDLTIHTEADLTNEQAEEGYGTAKAGGNLFISASSLTNGKKIEAGEKLILKAETIVNKAEGEMNGKAADFSTENMTNRGLVSADSGLSLQASSLKNLETGRIYGEQISIRADTLENRKDKDLEEKLASAMKRLKDKEKALDEAFAVDVTGFTKDSEKEAYFQTITGKQEDYDNAQKDVDAILSAMKDRKSASIAARGNMDIEGKTLLNSAGALLYSGGDMTLTEKGSVINRGGTINAQGNLSITAPVISNENESFSSERVWTSHVTNPKLIRIDQDGHPEKGQAFPESEFSRLSSGYGAYHNKGITPKEPLEEAAYGIITAPTEEELAEGEDPVDPSLVGTLAPNYAYDDPIFQQFGITSMTTARPKNGDPAQKVWDESYRKILDSLNVKIREYNREVEAYNNSIGAIEGAKIKNYTIIRTNTHTSEKKVTETKAGILSGGKNMTLVGDVTNENSRITAGKTLAVRGNLTNEETKNRMEKVTFGITQESYTKKKHFPHKAHRRHYRSEIFMTPQKDLENPASFGVAETKENSSDMSDSMDITKAGRENIQSYLNPFQSGNETHPGTVAGDKGTSIPFLSESALYSLHPEETATYLVETDPAFTNKHRFLSSDYMYRQMTWDPDRVTKRLGDGFYEQELVRQQIAGLTGMRYLNGYTDDEEEYKALMDAGIAYAKEYNLKPGISLTKEQMASLTSDMVWLETTTVTVHGKTYEVLYPKVYLKPGNMTLTADGSLISADTLVAETKETLENNASILGNTVVLKGNDVVNLGKILGKDISLRAERDITQKGLITGEDRAALTAGRDISMGNTIFHGKNQDILDTTAGIAVKGKEGVLLMESGRDIHLTGATLAALGDKGSMILSTGHNLTMDTDALEARKDMTEDRDNYIRTYRKTETTNTLTAGRDITMTAGNNIKARNTAISSENGTIGVKAGNDVTVENGFQKAADDYGLKYKESGFLSHKNTGFKSHDESKAVTGSLLSGDTVTIVSAGNTEVTASNIVGTNDVSIVSGKDTTITSAEEVEKHDYEKRVKKSGLLGGGLGFTIGSEKRNDQYKDEDITQKGSTIGSIAGNVTIEANKDVHVNASDIIAGKDISLTGENVDISSKDNVYHSDEKHEYKKSGLTVSVSGGTADVLSGTVNNIQKASRARDKQLKVLYGGEVYETIAKNKEALKNIRGQGMPGISVGVGSGSFKAEKHTETTEAVGSNLLANNDIQIIGKKDIAMKGSQAVGNTISMKAGGNIALEAAENRSISDTDESGRGSQAGMNFAPTGNSFYANASKGQGNEREETLIHTASQVTARENLAVESGKDTILRGSNVYGDKVAMRAGANLIIESVQDKEKYTSHVENKGMEMTTGIGKGGAGYGGISIGTSTGHTNSTYTSVTKQAGIAAGQKGYDIAVQGNTHLKGGIIDISAAKGKNTLTTGTLTWEDIENKANYKATAEGRNYSAAWTSDRAINGKKRGGLTGGTSPVKLQPVKGKADSITESAVSEGTINITDAEHQKQNVSDLNRQTKNALNRLEKIFDKEKVQERQELATEFAKLGAEKIGDIANEKNWSKDDPRRMLLHGLLGGITAGLGGNSILSGAVAEGSMERLQPLLDQFLKDHPDMREEVAAVIGYAAGQLVGEDGKVGAAAAWSGTRFNWLSHEQVEEYRAAREKAKTPAEKAAVDAEYEALDRKQDEQWLKQQESGVYENIFGNYGDLHWYVLVNAKDTLYAGSTFAQDAFTGGLDYRVSQATGKTSPIGTLMNTISSILGDSDIETYSYYGVEKRILFDLVTAGGELYVFRNAGLFRGIVYSSVTDLWLNSIKNMIAPPMTKEQAEQKNDEYIEDMGKNGFD